VAHHAELYGLPLPTFSLSLVVTSHLVLKVFARQLLLTGIVSPLTSVLVKLSNIPPTPEISSFPFSLCHCLVTHLSASDSFTTMALYKFTYLLHCLWLISLNTCAFEETLNLTLGMPGCCFMAYVKFCLLLVCA